MKGVDFRLAHLLVVTVEPQVVRTVAPEVLLVATKVQVPHLCFFPGNETIIIIIININFKDIEFKVIRNNQMAEISSQAVCVRQLSQLAEADVIEFVDDTIHFLKGNRVPFLSKYSEAFGGQARLIVPCRDFL